MLWWTLRQLKQQLTSDDSKMRKQAAQKLGEIKDTRAIEPLIAALKDGRSDVRRAAAEALVKIGEAAVEPLVAAFKDSGSNVRQVAAKALGEIGDARAVEPLVAVLKDSDSGVRQVAAWALRSLKWQPANDTQRAALAVADKRWDEAVRLGTAAVEPLATALKDSRSDVQVKAVYALWKIGDARAVELLVAALKDSNMDVMLSAALALGKIGDARAVLPLIQLTKNSNVAEAAVGALQNFLESEAALVAADTLLAVTALTHVYTTEIRYKHYACGGGIQSSQEYKISLDCSRLRQMARQELIRRGIKV
ncbi:MAG: HEAT repeat domain-containing protein [Blastocatellia bacterium]